MGHYQLKNIIVNDIDKKSSIFQWESSEKVRKRLLSLVLGGIHGLIFISIFAIKTTNTGAFMNNLLFSFTSKLFKQLFPTIKNWANQSIYHRILTIFTVGLVVIFLAEGIHSLAHHIYLKDMKQRYQDKSESLILEAKARLDEFNLCVRSKQSKNPNADLYCDEAIKNFKTTSWKIIPDEKLDAYKEKNAFELIVLNLQHAVRFFELPKSEQPHSLSSYISSELGILISSILQIFLVLSFILYLYWKPRQLAVTNSSCRYFSAIQQRLHQRNSQLIESQKSGKV